MLNDRFDGLRIVSRRSRLRIDDVGAPDTIRTCGLRLRRATLYPAELRVHLLLTQCLREFLASVKRRATFSQVFEFQTSFKLLFCSNWVDTCLRRAAEKSLLARLEMSLGTAFPALSPHSIGFARKHRPPCRRGRLWITIQDPADEIGRQPGEMD